MGVVRRQGLKDSIVSYLGVGIGAVNILYIYPRFLSKAEIGLLQFLPSIALLLAPFLMLGANMVSIRFFPIFKDEERQHNGFLALLMVMPLLGALLLSLLLFPLEGRIANYFMQQEVLLQRYYLWIPLLTIFVAYTLLLSAYTKNFFRIVVPAILENAFIKIGVASLVVLYALDWITLDLVVACLVGLYGLAALGNLLYLALLGQLHLSPRPRFLTADLLRQIATYGGFGILGSLGASAMLYLDKSVLPLFIESDGLDALGIYVVVGYIGLVIDIPRKSLEKITAPLVAEATRAKNRDQIADLYRRTSLNQLVFGSLMLLLIWLNTDALFDIMPNGDSFRPAKLVILVLGLSALVDMATGINAQIITYSDHYRFNILLITVLAITNLGLNYLFIKVMNLYIFGAAYATLISIVVYNLIKLLFIWRVWRLHPFSRNMLWIVLLSGGLLFTLTVLPRPGNPWLSILLVGSTITLVYMWLVLRLRLAPDINDLWNLALAKLLGR